MDKLIRALLLASMAMSVMQGPTDMREPEEEPASHIVRMAKPGYIYSIHPLDATSGRCANTTVDLSEITPKQMDEKIEQFETRYREGKALPPYRVLFLNRWEPLNFHKFPLYPCGSIKTTVSIKDDEGHLTLTFWIEVENWTYTNPGHEKRRDRTYTQFHCAIDPTKKYVIRIKQADNTSSESTSTARILQIKVSEDYPSPGERLRKSLKSAQGHATATSSN